MINKVIRGFTRMLGAPADWKPEDHGKCGALAILDIEQDYAGNGKLINSMISAWDVTPDELVKLRMGAPIYLRILGHGHPPVGLWVGDPPQDGVEPSEDELIAFQMRVEHRIGDILQADPACGGRVTTDSIRRLAKFIVDARRGGRADVASD